MTTKPPTAVQLTAANMVAIPNLSAVTVENGHPLLVWNGKSFVAAPATTPYTTPLYSAPDWWIKTVPAKEEPSLYLGGSPLGGNEL